MVSGAISSRCRCDPPVEAIECNGDVPIQSSVTAANPEHIAPACYRHPRWFATIRERSSAHRIQYLPTIPGSNTCRPRIFPVDALGYSSRAIEYLPRGVRLTAYGGDATDLPAHVLRDFLDNVAAGDAIVPIHRTYRLDDIAEAHADMEAGRATGKLVVLP